MAATGQQQQKTFQQALTDLMGEMGKAMGSQGADTGFLTAVIQACAQKLQQASPAVYGQPGGGQPNQMQGPGQGPGPMGPPPAGVRREPQIPPGAASAMTSADEMQRMTTVGAGA